MSMYMEELMDHYKNPRNFGTLDNPSVSFHDNNPLCGDEIDLFLKIEDGNVTGITFTGKGCAISVAAASLMTELIKGKTTKEVLELKNEDLLDVLGVQVNMMRMKCALLGLKAAQKAIIQHEARDTQ